MRERGSPLFPVGLGEVELTIVFRGGDGRNLHCSEWEEEEVELNNIFKDGEGANFPLFLVGGCGGGTQSCFQNWGEVRYSLFSVGVGRILRCSQCGGFSIVLKRKAWKCSPLSSMGAAGSRVLWKIQPLHVGT